MYYLSFRSAEVKVNNEDLQSGLEMPLTTDYDEKILISGDSHQELVDNFAVWLQERLGDAAATQRRISDSRLERARAECAAADELAAALSA